MESVLTRGLLDYLSGHSDASISGGRPTITSTAGFATRNRRSPNWRQLNKDYGNRHPLPRYSEIKSQQLTHSAPDCRLSFVGLITSSIERYLTCVKIPAASRDRPPDAAFFTNHSRFNTR